MLIARLHHTLRCLKIFWYVGSTRLGCFYVTAILSWDYGWGWVEVDVEAEDGMR